MVFWVKANTKAAVGANVTRDGNDPMGHRGLIEQRFRCENAMNGLKQGKSIRLSHRSAVCLAI